MPVVEKGNEGENERKKKVSAVQFFAQPFRKFRAKPAPEIIDILSRKVCV